MRRVLGLTLTGLGAFFLALALLLRFYLPGQVIKFPLNEYLVTTLVGHNVSYFSQKQGTVLTGVTAKATSTIEGDVAAGSGSVAVWNDFTAVQDTTNNEPIQYQSQRSAFDRRSGEIVDCCGAYVSVSNVGSHTAGQSGLAYAFPIGTQKQTYQVFDPTLARPEPFRYEGTATIDGASTLKFVERVTNQPFAQQQLPGLLVGYPDQPTVTLPEYMTETKTFWVDPATGEPVDVTQDETLALENAAGATKLVLFKGDLAATPQSIAGAVGAVNSSHLKIEFVEDIGPLVCLLLGVLLLVLGIALTVNQPDLEEFEYESDEPVGSAT
jgi:Porin PorA